MLKTIEATISPEGNVTLQEPVKLNGTRRALITILDETPHSEEAALLSEQSLAGDWNRPEEDAAWSHLQEGQ